MPKSRSTTGANENAYNKRGLDYGQRARDRREPIKSKGKDKGEQDGKDSQDDHLEVIRN